jgi:hypothetical protein
MHSQLLLRAWQAVALICAAIATALLLANLAHAFRIVVPGAQGFLGYDAAPSHLDHSSAHRIIGFEAESSLPSAGVVTGDLVVDPPRGTFRDGETVRLQVAHQGTVRNVEVKAARIDRLSTPVQNALDFGLDILVLLLGLMIALRRRRDLGALVLACVFFLAAAGLVPQALPAGRLAGAMDLWETISVAVVLPILAYFTLVFEGGYQSRARVPILRAIVSVGAAAGASALAMAPYFLGRVWLAPDFLLLAARIAAEFLGVVLCVLAFTDTWRHVEAERRERLRWLFVGFGFGLLNFCMFVVFGATGITAATAVGAGVVSDALVATAMLILAYAILRHRVIDVGFAVNRALVFAAFTGLLLVSFGIVEWLVEHFVRFASHERSMLLDGTIAVALYLVFHRARHWIERLVERVFFNSWHLKQAALQRFMDIAPNFSHPDALIDALLAAVDAYAGSCGSGLYWRNEAGCFVQDRSTLEPLPRELDADVREIVELRTFRVPVRLSDEQGLAPAALAFPMTRRSELVGFLVVGRKTDRQVYRVDEIANLARTAQQVGADLYTLRLEQLQRAMAGSLSLAPESRRIAPHPVSGSRAS